MPKTVQESLLGDHSDQWLDPDCPEPKRLKVTLIFWVTLVGFVCFQHTTNE